VPEHVALFHVLVGDVRDVDVQQAVVVVIADVGVHALLGVEADRVFVTSLKVPSPLLK
jgi:hypothetical protein